MALAYNPNLLTMVYPSFNWHYALQNGLCLNKKMNEIDVSPNHLLSLTAAGKSKIGILLFQKCKYLFKRLLPQRDKPS